MWHSGTLSRIEGLRCEVTIVIGSILIYSLGRGLFSVRDVVHHEGLRGVAHYRSLLPVQPTSSLSGKGNIYQSETVLCKDKGSLAAHA